jgi:predicted membrane protein
MTMQERSSRRDPYAPRQSPVVGDGTAPASGGWRVTPQLTTGLVIMAFGLLLMLDRLRLLDAGRVLRYWPAGLIAVGVLLWVRGRGARGRFWGSVWILIGSWLLLNTLGWLQVGFWELFWPVVLVLLGLKLVLHTRGAARDAGEASLFAMMGESKRSHDPAPFHGGQMTAIMGGCRLDLRQAIVPSGEEIGIEVFALMGGLELWVPSGWIVHADDVVPIMGGVEDKRLPPVPMAPGAPEPPPPPRLRLHGHVVMGGLSIKN